MPCLYGPQNAETSPEFPEISPNPNTSFPISLLPVLSCSGAAFATRAFDFLLMNPPEDASASLPSTLPLTNDDLRQFSLDVSGIGTWRLYPESQIVTWDDRCKELYGFAPNDEVPYDQVLRYMHPDDQAAVNHAVMAAIAGENEGRYEIQFRTIGATDGKTRWLLCRGKAFFNEAGQTILFAGTAQDITEVVLAQQQAARVEKMAQEAIANAKAGTYSFDLKTGEFLYSPQTKRIFSGIAEGTFTREDFVNRICEEDHAVRDAAHAEALQTGVLKYDCRVKWDDSTIHWVRVSGAYEFDKAGKPVLYTGILEDITSQKNAQLALEKSERFARNVVQDSPVAKFITLGENQVLEMMNREMLSLLGAPEPIIGIPLLEAIPALQNTSIPGILEQVRQTGTRTEVAEESFTGLNAANPQTRHYYHKHSPLRNESGDIYGVISSWIDVTNEVELRNQAAAAQALLEAALEAAQLGTFEINPKLGIMEVSPRICAWMGFDPGEAFTREEALATLTDSGPLQAALHEALLPDSDGVVDIEYQMINRKTGTARFIRSRGQRFYDHRRGPIIVGTSQDITSQRSYALALEQQVQVRTEELAAAVEELQATNEELAMSNTQLTHSNEELAQYAYVASHDLQEPLRKIQVFSGMLAGKGELGPASRELIGKIGQSATRMAQLIRDLLEFSRLLNSDSRYQPTNLNVIVKAVRNDFELISREKGAVFLIEDLPTVEAVPLQMNQLFYNLIGNALKFTRPGVAPEIQISASSISQEEAARYVPRVLPAVRYWRLCIQDNGIGFEAEYAEQIFEVFKRLHTRDAYPGSGIGLALCRRILANHHGVLYTEPVSGKGAVFYLIVPDRQER